MALVIAVVAMAVLGALVAGVFFAALRDQRDGRDAVSRVRAFAAAEYGLALQLAPGYWRSEWNTSAERGLLAAHAFDPGAGAAASMQLWKLTAGSFLVVSTGVAGSGSSRASRRLSLLVAPRAPRLAAAGAITVREGATISGASSISGLDGAPSGWDCPPPEDALPAVATLTASLVDVDECTAVPCLDGASAVRPDSAAAVPGSYEQFGEVSRSTIAAAGRQLDGAASIVAPAPSLDAAGNCNHADQRNLGDPLRALGAGSPCAPYVPVLHAPGTLRISGGAGQGFLLVDGDLTLDNGARMYGVVAVLGELRMTGGAELHGLALASRVTLAGGAHLRYSSCAAELALRAAAVPVVPSGQAWSEMY